MKADDSGGWVVELDDGIFLIPGRPTGGCNVFVVKGQHKTILIDVGLPDDYHYLCSSLTQIGLCIDEIDMVLITHEHIDHVGCLPQLPKRIVVAAHERAANKFALGDQFSTMGGTFNTGAFSPHIDVHLTDGAVVDLGGLQLRVIYSPGHCSGAVCFYEARRGILFTGDTVYAGGILGGIFASGYVSDYIGSLRRLREFRLVKMYPGHGNMSHMPSTDIERAIEGAMALMSDTQSLFDAIDIKNAVKNIRHAAVDYSRRAAERRYSLRTQERVTVVAPSVETQQAIFTINVSLHGIRLNQVLSLAVGDSLTLTLSTIGDFNCQVVAHASQGTQLRILRSSPGNANLKSWLDQHAPDAHARRR